ncbi:MAG: cryptochrome/photolyase family protein, partial [Bacteroidota bacterium]
MKTLRLILGDQLNALHSWFSEVDSDTVYLMAEMHQETQYVKHHIQKVVGFFSAMRNFASHLEKQGHQVEYIRIGDADSHLSLSDIIQKKIEAFGIEKFEYQLPDEFRLDEQLSSICKSIEIPSEAYDTEHFYTSRYELKDFFEGKKQLIMESFYRMMRKKHDIMMVNGQPDGGKWNFDHSNRKKWTGSPEIPQELNFEKDVTDVLQEIEAEQIPTFGTLNAEKYNWPTSHEECQQLLDYFC